MALVILTGASGSGKTAIAKTIEARHPSITVFGFDTIGVPSAEVMASFGSGYQPGGAWQRAMTFEWLERIAPVLAENRDVLFEGQMRIAFIREALAASKIENARVLCVDCDDATRTQRLSHDRLQPELANESMMRWSRYLHQEARGAGYEILDTTDLSLSDSVSYVLSIFEALRRPMNRNDGESEHVNL
jgi:RNase adaptor protein for sRNA GlmZ degradation